MLKLPSLTPGVACFLWFVGFCFLANQWQATSPDELPLAQGSDAARATIAFCFFSILTWVCMFTPVCPCACVHRLICVYSRPISVCWPSTDLKASPSWRTNRGSCPVPHHPPSSLTDSHTHRLVKQLQQFISTLSKWQLQLQTSLFVCSVSFHTSSSKV